MHRNPFKPHKDHPSLNEVMEEGQATPRTVDVREAFYRAFTGDAKRAAESLNHGQ